MRGRAGIASLAVASCLGLAPAAQAADTFADAAIGNDANECTSGAAPCATVGAALAKSGTGDTVRVAPGIYPEQLEVGGGRSLRATGTAASTVLSPAASPAIDVTSAAGTIEGFTIRAPGSEGIGTLRLQAPATVRGNIFDSDDDAGGTVRPVDVRIGAGAGSPVITENSFVDDGVGNQTGVGTFSAGSPTISENRMDGFFRGIDVSSGTPTVRDNVIRGSHNSPTLSQGAGIMVQDGAANTSPQLRSNLIASPAADAANGVTVIDFVHGAGSTTVGAALSRNRILDHSFGVVVSNATNSPVTLESDLIARSATQGLSAADGVGSSSNVTATNVTFADNVLDVSGNDVTLTLNSAILEDAIGATVGTNCVITFSRLSSTATPSTPSCDDAATTDTPAYVAAADRDYHLLGFPANPALFGGGDPASPPAGSRDFDGDLRELPPNGTSASRREIGADEILPGGYAPADTTISTGPEPGGTAGAAPAFGFNSTEPSSTFECSLDGRAFAPCTSPKSYAGLGAGAHTFAVRTIDPTLQGNTDPTPATRSFTVDASPPDTEVTEGPAEGSLSDGGPAFTLSSEPGATFECSLDRAAFAPCGAMFEPTGLTDGEHRLTARAIDSVGNADPTAATRSWNVDATAPETTIDSGPADGATSEPGEVTYGFSANEAATFECSVDGGAFAACTSPRSLDFAPGAHAFAVRAIDGVGNTDGSPATRSLTIRRGGGDGNDTDPPETTILKVKVKGDDAKAKFTSDEPGSTFECKLDRKKFKPCRSPRRLKNLDDGKHKLKVRAVDRAGNRDASPAKKRFGV